jgi:3'-5' exoribonuclease
MNDKEYLTSKVESISSHRLKQACLKVIQDDRFFIAPAASKKHQAFTGGLAQHTREVMDIALATASADCLKNFVDKNVIIAGVLWHDYGKIWDYKKNEEQSSPMPANHLGLPASNDPKPEWVYDRHRWTIRHLSRSYAEFLIAATAAGCFEIEIEEVAHCILSHHGRHEYGSPVTPLSIEASIIHNSDSIDAVHVGKPHIFRTDRPDWKNP